MTSQSGQPADGPCHDERARRVIASYGRYADAEAAVDYLADQRFPVERVAIIGRDVHMVEQVTGRLTYWGAALHGAAAGALPGALIGWIFGLLNWINPLLSAALLALYGLVFGAIVGALINVVIHAMQRGRRDFSAIRMMQPTRFEIVADVDVADEAVRQLEARRPVAT